MKNIYKEADIVSLHIPLTKETSNLINRNFIKNFQKEIYLINTARGRCVNTKELVSALKSGKIKGACLDVFADENKSFENLSEDELTAEMQYLINSDKTILSSHIAGWTVESNIKISTILLQKITSDFDQ
jgi:D-3-phosphoglycerate dehydrogenase